MESDESEDEAWKDRSKTDIRHKILQKRHLAKIFVTLHTLVIQKAFQEISKMKGKKYEMLFSLFAM